jgi:hypothetical protein
MWHDLGTALVLVHRDQLVRDADTNRLARLATACRHIDVRARVDALTHWLRAGQLGSGYVDRPAAPVTARCTV